MQPPRQRRQQPRRRNDLQKRKTAGLLNERLQPQLSLLEGLADVRTQMGLRADPADSCVRGLQLLPYSKQCSIDAAIGFLESADNMANSAHADCPLSSGGHDDPADPGACWAAGGRNRNRNFAVRN